MTNGSSKEKIPILKLGIILLADRQRKPETINNPEGHLV
jgi:hypothetical protein